nr:MAG TPA: tail tape measure [Caudoviricetes sp.]
MYDGTLKFDTSMDTSGFQKDANGLSNIVKGMSVFSLLEKGFNAVTASLDSAISRYDTLNKFPKVLEQMGFSTEEASTATQKLSDGISGLPTTLDSVVSTAQRLTVLTGNLETSTDLTLALNNAFLASGASSDDASRGLQQYVQMLSSGKVDMESWRTLQETMGLALNRTAEAFGYAGESAQNDLYAALQSGEITFDQFSNKLIELNDGVGGFAEMAQVSTGGIGTAWANLQTAIVKGTTSIITAIDSGLSKTRFKSIENIISGLTDGIRKGFDAAASAVEFLASKADALVPILITVGTAVAAWKVTSVLSGVIAGFQTAALQVSLYSMSVSGAITADALQTAGLTAEEIIVGVLTGKIGLATVAQYAWNAAMTANPIGLIIAGVAALTAGIVLLVKALSSGSAAYKKQKEEVDALTDAQEELCSSIEESSDAFDQSNDEVKSNAAVASDLVDQIEDTAKSYDSLSDKADDMRDLVGQLNTAVEGLNITYDEETGTIRNLNSGQELSLEQLRDLVDAKNELAEAESWTARQNELLSEQVQIQNQLEQIEQRRQEILSDTSLTTREQNNLIADLDASVAEYTAQMEESEAQLAVVNDNLASSTAESAQQIVDNYTLMESAVTKSGENIDQVAQQWGVSTEEIAQAMQDQDITLDEWVANQEDAWAALQDTVQEKAEGIVNGFEKIPEKFEMSAQDMLSNMQSNKEAYARWEANMAEITRQLGPTFAEEIGKLGPAANSAMEEILASPELLDQYRQTLGVKIDEATGTAIEEWNDPNFIFAASTAVDASAAQVSANPSLNQAVQSQVDGTRQAFDDAIAAADFGSVGTSIDQAITDGVSSLDLSGVVEKITTQMQQASTEAIKQAGQMMMGITNAISARTTSVKNQATRLATGVTDALKHLPADAVSHITRMMSQLSSAILSRRSLVTTQAKLVADGVLTELKRLPDEAESQMRLMLSQAAAAILSRRSLVTTQANAVASEVAGALNQMSSAGYNAGLQLMSGIRSGLIAGQSSVYSKASEIANTVASRIRKALQVHSPSRVMIDIFENVMKGAIEGLDSMKNKLYTTADTIAGSVSQHLTIPSELAGLTNAALLRTADATLANIPSTYSSAVQTGASSGTGNSEELLRKAVALLDEYLPEVAGMQVVLDTGAAVGAMAPAMDQALGRRARMKARG